jgi:hypothetical protein
MTERIPGRHEAEAIVLDHFETHRNNRIPASLKVRCPACKELIGDAKCPVGDRRAR